MSEFDTEAIVVGAGAVGLAIGYALAQRGIAPIVIERANLIGSGVSSRNSEVVHAGLYYPTGSLKARLCVEGADASYAFCDAHKVDYDRCGKLVVACEEDELERMDAILEQANINGVPGMEVLSAAQAKALEPELRTVGALLSPNSGTFDSHGYMTALEGRIEDVGGSVVLSTPFEHAEPLPGGGFLVRTGGADPMELTTERLFLAAGLSCADVANRVEGFPKELIPTIHFGKGNYFSLQGKAPFRKLIYPMPIKGALGTHYRRDLGGQARFGPDLHFVEHENYDVELDREPLFYQTIRRFWPGLKDGTLMPDYTGIRPKLHGPNEKQPDFRIEGPSVHGIEGLVALFGIESPGLTSSLAVGAEAVARQ